MIFRKPRVGASHAAVFTYDTRREPMPASALRQQRGFSVLETIAATAIGMLVLGGAAEQTRSACLTVRQAREVSSAVTAARNVLDLALATTCAPVQNAVAICAAGLRCTVAATEIARRTDASGTVILLHLAVEVRTGAEGPEDRRLARLVTVAARPESCA